MSKTVATKRLTLYLTDAEWESLMIIADHEKHTMHDWAKDAMLGVLEIAADSEHLAIPMPPRP